MSAPTSVLPVSAIHRLLADHADPRGPGAAVAVLRHGEPLFARGYGLARVEDGVAVHERTNFRLASITKQFTAKAAALLMEDGSLSLDTAIRDVLPLPSWGRHVRIGHLVCHTSGIPPYEALVPETQTAQLTDQDVVRLLAGRSELDFQPGSRFRYDNGGYALLARAIEERSGRDFATFLAERIFRPLGMTGTVAHVEGRTVVDDRALGYRPVPGGFVEADQGPATAVLGDGGIYSNVRDLAVWDAALCTPDFQPDPAALAPYGTPGTEGARYGFGWFLDGYRGRRRQRHEGWTTGFQNEIQRFPEEGWTVIMLTNRAAPPAQPLTEAIADLMLGQEAPS